MKKLLLFLLLVLVIGCADNSKKWTGQYIPTPKDGELDFPSEYTSYPTFLKEVQKPLHVRDLYVNEVGAKTQRGEAFPNGSILVMEIYNAETNPAGTINKGPRGKNIKADLVKVYVMQKGEGWGNSAPAGLENGDWIYTAFTPDGEPMSVDYATCRGCHLPLNENDFVHRYDEYFDKRGQ